MALSSTRSTRFPDRFMLCGQLSFCGSFFSARCSISNGTVNVLPIFSALSSSIVPPISSTISLTIESPRPEPLNVVVDRLPSCAKASNACFWNSSLIPRPVSEHTNWKTAIFPSSDNSSQWTFTVPWKWLYLIALEERFIKILLRCTGLPIRCLWRIVLASTPPSNLTPFS